MHVLVVSSSDWDDLRWPRYTSRELSFEPCHQREHRATWRRSPLSSRTISGSQRSQPPPRGRGLGPCREWRTVGRPAPGASRAWVTCAIIMLHEQTQVAKCLRQQAADIDTPPTTLDSRLTRHRQNTTERGCARRIRGGRAVRRRLRRSIGESGGEGWGAAEGRGRGRRRVEPWRG